MRAEILVGFGRRRRWTDEQKLQILAEVGIDGASVADVAQRHDVARQHLFQWRTWFRRRRRAVPAPSEVCFLSAEPVTEPPPAQPSSRCCHVNCDVIELDVLLFCICSKGEFPAFMG
ncbi:transposase [Asaia krungthepensis]